MGASNGPINLCARFALLAQGALHITHCKHGLAYSALNMRLARPTLPYRNSQCTQCSRDAHKSLSYDTSRSCLGRETPAPRDKPSHAMHTNPVAAHQRPRTQLDAHSSSPKLRITTRKPVHYTQRPVAQNRLVAPLHLACSVTATQQAHTPALPIVQVTHQHCHRPGAGGAGTAVSPPQSPRSWPSLYNRDHPDGSGNASRPTGLAGSSSMLTPAARATKAT